MKTVLVPTDVYSELDDAATGLGLDIELAPYTENDEDAVDVESPSGLFRWIAGVRYASLVAQFPTIKWLHTASAGVDHVLTSEVKSRAGMVVTDSGPAFGPAIAEYVLGAMLGDARRFAEFRANQKNRHWEKLMQRELFGATIGIVGLGPIGQAVAGRAKAFGMNTIGFRRSIQATVNIDRTVTGPEGLTELLSTSDYVVVAAALTGETKHLIGSAELALMKPTALLINIARGGLIDEAALVDTLLAKRIHGAVLDVFTTEPLPVESALWDLPNVFVTPHHSFGGTTGLKSRQITLFLENLSRFAMGQPLENVVNIDRGY